LATSDYAKVKDIMTQEEFESRVRSKVDEWAGLLDERTAVLLVLDELGRLDVPFSRIKDLQDAQEVSVRGKVTSISPVREFTRKTGETGRVVNVQIDDGSGMCHLVLWDNDVRLVEQGYVKMGRTVRALDCYARRSNFGLEISRGKFGSVVAED
jgi:ssDNA-binding replication factor A large subunit